MAIVACSGGAPGSSPAGLAGRTPGSGEPNLAVDFEASSSSDLLTGSGESVVATALADEIVARAGPSADAEVVARIDNPRPSGVPLVMLTEGAVADAWVEVLLPVRPNGTTGWIPAASVELARNPYRIELDTGAHQLLVFDGDRVVVSTEVAIGTGETPTPIGRFYLTELLEPIDRTGPYGTRAFGLSGYSETLQSFNGGDGVVGIHGTDDPASLGTNVSHGCIRVGNETIEEMASFLPLGTPVLITGSS